MRSSSATRDRILDALQELLIDSGERGATLEAVAARARVSKGGLLYHFGSKDALVHGLIERLGALVEADVVEMRSAPSGPVEHFIRNSAKIGGELDRSFIALTRLAQGAQTHAANALRDAQAAWLAVITEVATDPAAARAIVLLGDGIYYSASMGSAALSAADMDALVHQAHKLAGLTR